MSDQMELDLFCDWFEGKFDNWGQASSNPTKWPFIPRRLESRIYFYSLQI